jgi:ParB family chromosome partitioning protein
MQRTGEDETYDPDPLPPQAPLAIAEIPIDWIEANPWQPRTHFDEDLIAELADSIRVQGIIQPLTVRRLTDRNYQLISGERRLLASRRAGLTTVPAYIRTANDEQMIELALIENIQRQDLNPLEIAIAYKRLMDECQLVIEQVGEKVGKKRSTVNNYLRLLKLPPDIQLALREERLTMGHARALLGLEDPMQQLLLFRKALDNGWSVRQVEEEVRRLQQPVPPQATPKPPSAYEVQLRALQQQLSNRYGTRVRIHSSERGVGEIRLSFFSDDDLNRLLALLDPA